MRSKGYYCQRCEELCGGCCTKSLELVLYNSHFLPSEDFANLTAQNVAHDFITEQFASPQRSSSCQMKLMQVPPIPLYPCKKAYPSGSVDGLTVSSPEGPLDMSTSSCFYAPHTSAFANREALRDSCLKVIVIMVSLRSAWAAPKPHA